MQAFFLHPLLRVSSLNSSVYVLHCKHVSCFQPLCSCSAAAWPSHGPSQSLNIPWNMSSTMTTYFFSKIIFHVTNQSIWEVHKGVWCYHFEEQGENRFQTSQANRDSVGQWTENLCWGAISISLKFSLCPNETKIHFAAISSILGRRPESILSLVLKVVRCVWMGLEGVLLFCFPVFFVFLLFVSSFFTDFSRKFP